jgi:hypothetical protein
MNIPELEHAMGTKDHATWVEDNLQQRRNSKLRWAQLTKDNEFVFACLEQAYSLGNGGRNIQHETDKGPEEAN